MSSNNMFFIQFTYLVQQNFKKISKTYSDMAQSVGSIKFKHTQLQIKIKYTKLVNNYGSYKKKIFLLDTLNQNGFIMNFPTIKPKIWQYKHTRK